MAHRLIFPRPAIRTRRCGRRALVSGAVPAWRACRRPRCTLHHCGSLRPLPADTQEYLASDADSAVWQCREDARQPAGTWYQHGADLHRWPGCCRCRRPDCARQRHSRGTADMRRHLAAGLMTALLIAACGSINAHYDRSKTHHRPDGFSNSDASVRIGSSLGVNPLAPDARGFPPQRAAAAVTPDLPPNGRLR